MSNNSSIPRPFGDAVIDGVDFDFEDEIISNIQHFANQLRSLYGTDTHKPYYMTAAPQCVYPDEADGPMLSGTVYFDAIWVQFYNNGCGIDNFVPDATTQWNFDFNTWDNWAHTISFNPSVKVFLGVPGSTKGGSGYEPGSFVGEVIEFIYQQGYTSFGGLMMWDASDVWNNTGFLSTVSSYLQPGSPSPKSSTTASSVITSTSSNTSTTLTSTTSVATTASTAPTTTATGTVGEWGQVGNPPPPTLLAWP